LLIGVLDYVELGGFGAAGKFVGWRQFDRGEGLDGEERIL
jgi:hypothetical protein